MTSHLESRSSDWSYVLQSTYTGRYVYAMVLYRLVQTFQSMFFLPHHDVRTWYVLFSEVCTLYVLQVGCVQSTVSSLSVNMYVHCSDVYVQVYTCGFTKKLVWDEKDSLVLALPADSVTAQRVGGRSCWMLGSQDISGQGWETAAHYWRLVALTVF
jgi:hypothetical protein